MISFRKDKCPLCGGRISDNICVNGDCMLGQFTTFTYTIDGIKHKLSGIDGDTVVTEEQRANTEEAII